MKPTGGATPISDPVVDRPIGPGAIVRVPFPYTDRTTRQYRPAVVVSAGGLGTNQSILWVVMVTSAENRRWPGDISLEVDHAGMGLPIPSLIRTTKIAAIDARDVDWRGTIGHERLAELQAQLLANLGLGDGA